MNTLGSILRDQESLNETWKRTKDALQKLEQNLFQLLRPHLSFPAHCHPFLAYELFQNKNWAVREWGRWVLRETVCHRLRGQNSRSCVDSILILQVHASSMSSLFYCKNYFNIQWKIENHSNALHHETSYYKGSYVRTGLMLECVGVYFIITLFGSQQSYFNIFLVL